MPPTLDAVNNTCSGKLHGTYFPLHAYSLACELPLRVDHCTLFQRRALCGECSQRCAATRAPVSTSARERNRSQVV